MDAVIRSINNDYRAFEYYQEHNTEIERHTLEDFAQSSTSHGDGSIRSNLEELHSLIVPEGGVLGDKGILHLLANGIQVCVINFKNKMLLLKKIRQIKARRNRNASSEP